MQFTQSMQESKQKYTYKYFNLYDLLSFVEHKNIWF